MKLSSRTARAAMLPIALTLLAAPASAADGALEIHQACIATGCFPGDLPGPPVEIFAPGLYVFTSNVTVPDETTSGIEVVSDFVVIDLNGFVLSGVTECPGPPDPCAPLGSGRGVGASNPDGVVVRNGTIRGFGSLGTFLGDGARVENVHAQDNGSAGIVLQNSGVVHGCVSRHNGGPGIMTGAGAVVTDNLSERNLGHGIEAGTAATVSRNSALVNAGDGIRVGPTSAVTDNSISTNEGSGLSLSSIPAAGYAQNVLNDNADGTAANQVSGAAVQTGGNVCASALCP
jgi:hypothetical protein